VPFDPLAPRNVFAVDATIDLGAIAPGFSRADFGSSIGLESVTLLFPDGSVHTPESLGAQLVFDSGIQSPNIGAVPVPSTLAMSVIAIGLALSHKCLRRPARNAEQR